jgi:glucose/arabinose dehydrogenase
MRFGPVALAVLLAACSGAESVARNGGGQPAGSGAPVEQGPPNSPEQQPAFPGQTRAPAVSSGFELQTRVVVSGLEQPWAVEILPNGRLLVTEQAGRLRIVGADGRLGDPISGLPSVDYRGQGGLLDAALSPTFSTDRLVYWSYSEPREGGNGTAVARGRLSADERSVENVEVIWRMRPTMESSLHFGSRLVFAPDGHLFVTTGDRSILPGRAQARRLDSHLGKVVRIRPDGSPAGVFTEAGALPDLWSIGHRNLQSAALDPQGRLWTVEHGPRGGDELNRPEGGKDYGWPDATYGEEYSGRPVGEGRTQVPGTEQPIYYWDPVIGPSGMAFYDGAMFPEWRGNALVGGLRSKDLVRLVIRNDRVVGEERLLGDKGWRVRDVAVGADGALWIVTDEQNGNLVRVTRGG